MLAFQCPHCQYSGETAREHSGRWVPCPRCQQSFQISTETPHSDLEDLTNTVRSSPSHLALTPSKNPEAKSQELPADLLSNSYIESVFEHIEQLGEGGMGQVWRVRDRRIGRQAAIKILKDPHPSPELSDRFLRESKITALLDHPAIPPVYDVGRNSKNQLYMLMKVIDGQTLLSLIREHHQDPNESDRRRLLEAFVKICEAISYAHSMKVIHRDLKPENVMLGPFGEVLVLDWGLAKILDANSLTEPSTIVHSEKSLTGDDSAVGLTEEGSLIGTLGYMPPEQANGEALSSRADVFALGATLTEILTGRPPIDGPSRANRLNATIKGHIETPLERDPTLPPSLCAIAEEALAYDAEDRTIDAQDIVRNVKAYLAGEELDVYHYSPWERSLRALKRHTGLVLSLVLSALFFSLFLVLWSETRRLDAARLNAQLQSQMRAQKLALNQQLVELAQQGEAAALREGSRLSKVLKLRKELQSAAKEPDSLKQLQELAEELLTSTGRSSDSLRFAAKQLAYAGSPQDARRWLKECIEEHPPAYDALLELHKLQSQGLCQGTDALALLVRRSSKDQADNPYTQFAKALEFDTLGQYQRAQAIFSSLEAKAAEFSTFYYLRGTSHLSAGESRKAIKDFSQSIQQVSEVARSYTNRGYAYIQVQDYNQALRDFEEALRRWPKLDNAYVGRAFAYRRLGKTKLALRDLNRALEINPMSSHAMVNKSQLLCDARKIKEGMALLNKAIEVNPRTLEAWINRASLHRFFRRWDAAQSDWEEARRLAPKRDSVLYERAIFHFERAEPAPCLKSLEELLRLYPKHHEGLSLKGQALIQVSDMTAARQCFEQALKINPTSPHALTGLGTLAKRQGLLTEAEKHFSNGLSAHPNDAVLLGNRGATYMNMGRVKEALTDLDKAHSIDPMSSEILINRGFCHWLAKQPQQSTADFKRAAEIDPKNPELYLLQATIRITEGDDKAAFQLFNQAISANPKYIPSYLKRAQLRIRKRAYAEALASYNQAIEVNPRWPASYNDRGTLFQILERYQDALKDFNKALELNPNYASAYYNKGVILDHLKDTEGALVHYQKCLKLDPKRCSALTNMAYIFLKERRYAEAEPLYLRALKLEAKNWIALYSMGLLKTETRDYQAAQGYFQKALAIKADDQGCLRHLKDIERALKDPSYHPITRSSDENPPVRDKTLKEQAKELNKRAHLAFQKGSFKLALKLIEDALKLDANDPELRITRAKVFEGLRQYPKAFADLNWVLERNPRNCLALYNRHVLFYKTKNPKGAIADLSSILSVDPKMVLARLALVRHHWRGQEFSKARAHLTVVFKEQPDNVEALNLSGVLYGQQQLWQKALENFNRAIQVQPQLTNSYANRALVYKHQKKFKEALADLDTVVRLQPSVARNYVMRGLTREQAGQFDKAIDDYRQFLSLAPNHPRALEFRNRIQRLKNR